MNSIHNIIVSIFGMILFLIISMDIIKRVLMYRNYRNYTKLDAIKDISFTTICTIGIGAIVIGIARIAVSVIGIHIPGIPDVDALILTKTIAPYLVTICICLFVLSNKFKRTAKRIKRRYNIKTVGDVVLLFGSIIFMMNEGTLFSKL